MRGDWNGRGVEISVERDARQQVAAMAEPLFAVAAGDLLRPEGGYGASAGFLERLLEGEEAVFEVSAMDAGDKRALRFGEDLVMAIERFDSVASHFDCVASRSCFTFI